MKADPGSTVATAKRALCSGIGSLDRGDLGDVQFGRQPALQPAEDAFHAAAGFRE
jgi:hypothetical protein